MTRKMTILLPVFTLSVLTFLCGLTNQKDTMLKESAGELTIVELFTSEGCSSCPPAERLLIKTAAEKKDVYVVSYHVDYWNHLGWKDSFSQSLFTNRQRQYAKFFNLESIYTPQVVVNGAEEFVGSDVERLQAALLRSTALPSLGLQVVRKSAASMTAFVATHHSEPIKLHIALIQPKAISEIKRGENRGRTLQHINVVRQLTTIDWQSAGSAVEIEVPVSLQDKEFELLLFSQHKRDNRIKAASKTLIPRFTQ